MDKINPGQPAVDGEIEKRLSLITLYDFYGELLKDNQKRVFEDSILEDLSLGEIAEEIGISRQGVHDLIKRTCRQLESFEERLHLAERFRRVKDMVEALEQRMQDDERFPEAEAGEIRATLQEILEEL